MVDATKHELQTRQLPRVITIRTDEWPAHDRLAMFHQTFAGDRIRVEPSRHESLQIDVTLMKLPGLGLLWGRRSALRSEFEDGHDRLMFNFGRDALAKQFGREVILGPGDAIALSGADLGSLTTLHKGPIATLEFPQGALGAMLKDVDSSYGRRIPKNSPALQLLRGYVDALHESQAMNTFALQPLAISHIYDLAALALGATREAEEIAKGRGIRVARLHAIKTDILSDLGREVSLSEIAVRHGVSPRYVRLLFEGEGTSFTEFVREERLRSAHAKLLSRRFDHLRISEIAYDVGFNDLSYFNRAFRRRYGHAPGEVRGGRLSR